tara:strand:- start:238 stop:486 length:249 start_codon:yes stop_codon:yes gene_type:complete
MRYQVPRSASHSEEKKKREEGRGGEGPSPPPPAVRRALVETLSETRTDKRGRTRTVEHSNAPTLDAMRMQLSKGKYYHSRKT